MKKLQKLAKALSGLNLHSHSNAVIKLAGEGEVKYLEELNWNSLANSKMDEKTSHLANRKEKKEFLSKWKEDTSPEEKKEFWSNLKKEFDSRQGGGPIFDKETLDLVMGFDSKRLPKKNGKLFVKWLARWIGSWNELGAPDQNTILDWWSATGGVEEGRSFDEKIIEILTPDYALQRAEEYHNGEGFYFDPTERYLTPPNENVIHDFGDGFKIVYVPAFGEMEGYPLTEEELKTDATKNTSHDRIVEGNKMGVCLGKKMRLYQNNNSGKIYSLRNSANEPCVTIRAITDYEDDDDVEVDYDDPDYEPFDNSKTIFKVLEFQGLGNSVPSKKYADYILRFFDEVEGHDEVEVSDRETLLLTKMNSKDQEERISAMAKAKDNELVGNKILSTDWKTLKKDDPDLFKKIVINALFKSKDDSLDSTKLGGDEEKRNLIKESWKDFSLYSQPNITKKISFSTGEELLIEIIPEILSKASLNSVLFPDNHYIRLEELKDKELRSILWNKKVKLEPVANLKNFDANRIIEFFGDEVISDGGTSDTVRGIVKLLLEDKEYDNKTTKNLVKIQPILIPVVNSTPGIKILLHNCKKLNDDVFQILKKKRLESLYGISPFSILTEVTKSGMSLEKNDYLTILQHSNKEVCGNTREIYELIQFIDGTVIRMKPLDIFDQEFWGRCLLQNLNAAKGDETTFTIWIIAASASAPMAVKDDFFKLLKENRSLLSTAWDTYSLGSFFSREELREILNHHGVKGGDLESQY
jgi:hypothetical protein